MRCASLGPVITDGSQQMHVGRLAPPLGLAPLAAAAQETAALDLSINGGVLFNTLVSLNLPRLAPDQAGKLAEEEPRRNELYIRSAGECAILQESVANSCAITAVSVSSQTNSNPGQPDYLYASSSITMQVELK